MLLEVCVDDVAGLEAAISGGADRIELCSALALGGLTPSAGLMAAASARPVDIYAMIRPRAGDFVYSQDERAVMMADIDAARQAGLSGVVLGASLPDGRLDVETLKALTAGAKGLGLTLHRAFDLVPDIADAVETAIALGFDRILTSGGEKTALEGVAGLEQAISAAAGRISIMPGSGVNTATAGALLARLAIGEIHASCSVAGFGTDERLLELGFATADARRTDIRAVQALKALIG